MAAAAQANSSVIADPSAFAPASSTALGKAYKSFDTPLSSAISGESTTKFNDAYTKMTSAYSQAVTAYRDVANANPNDPSIQFALAQTAEQAQDYKTAITAYKRFIKLAPEDPTVSAVRQRIKLLNAQAQLPTASTG